MNAVTRPQASCAGCGESVDAPDSALGHAVVGAFEDMHRGHDAPAGDDSLDSPSERNER